MTKAQCWVLVVLWAAMLAFAVWSTGPEPEPQSDTIILYLPDDPH